MRGKGRVMNPGLGTQCVKHKEVLRGSSESVRHFGGEFDPGSGSTLAACLMHASRAGSLSGDSRGGRVRNTWATYPGAGDSHRKRWVIPRTFAYRWGEQRKAKATLGGA